MSERKAYIYAMTNDITGEKYIGQTVNRPLRRYKHHLADAFNSKESDSTSKLAESIRKYGPDAFTLTVLETVPFEERYSREMFYINKYNTCNNGLNSNLGCSVEAPVRFKLDREKQQAIIRSYLANPDRSMASIAREHYVAGDTVKRAIDYFNDRVILLDPPFRIELGDDM